MKSRIILQSGDIVNDLTVLKLDHKDERSRRFFLCRCICGTEKVIQASHMTSGNTKSCGCLGRKIRKARRISKHHSEVTAIILSYKRHARTRNIKFMLTRNEVESIIFKKCNYCGCEPSNKIKTKNSIGDGLYYNGIDRVDSNKGYTIDNTAPCCKDCNLAKRDKNKKDFLAWINRVQKHQDTMSDQ